MKSFDHLKDQVPGGISQSVEAIIKAVKRDEFAVAETIDDRTGEFVYLFCSYQSQGPGKAPVVRTLCQLIPLDAKMEERVVGLKKA